jgi:glycine betaine/proline transport system substrate-binding protein
VHRLRRKTVAYLVASAFTLAGVLSLTSCSNAAPEPDDGAAEATSGFDRSELRPTIKIGVAGWSTARLNVAVAESLIERRLGYPVEPVEITDFGAMFQDLERGDDLHAVLEVWPNSLEERERAYLDQNRVLSFGELGVTGRIGWYMPADSAVALGVTTWQDLADPAVVAALGPPRDGAGADDATLGRFLGINPSYEQYDEDLIAELGLPLAVEFSGSESATRREVSDAVATGQPILVYWWTPTELAVEAELVEIQLPPWDEECEADRRVGDATVCGYRPERLLKLGSPELDTLAPEVEVFLRDFVLTNADQESMLAELARGRTISEAANYWIEENPGTWEAWFDDLG